MEWIPSRKTMLAVGSYGSLVCFGWLCGIQGIQLLHRRTVLPDATGPNVGLVDGSGPPVRLLLVGESTVAGVGAETHWEALAGQTARALAEASGRAVRWQALGRSGATLAIARRELTPKLKSVEADLVVLAIGGNDTLQMRSPKRWLSELERLIAAVRAQLGDIPILFAGTPRFNQTPFFPEPLRSVVTLRAQLLEHITVEWIKAQQGIIAIPAGDLTVTPDMLACDQFHPGPKGYQMWGRRIADYCLPVIDSLPQGSNLTHERC